MGLSLHCIIKIGSRSSPCPHHYCLNIIFLLFTFYRPYTHAMDIILYVLKMLSTGGYPCMVANITSRTENCCVKFTIYAKNFIKIFISH
jgi:hypothetical protein